MQAYYLDINLVRSELNRIGLPAASGRCFADTGICHAFKLRHLPEEVLEDLKKQLPDKGIAFESYKESNDATSAIIAGSALEINDLAGRLIRQAGALSYLGKLLSDTLAKAINQPSGEIKIGESLFKPGEKTLVMGILNVTPDSFSDGGRFDHLDRALEQAYRMAEEGADIIDIGGESTRPGYEKEKRVTADEEIDRVLPVIERLKKDPSFKLPLSIDTYKAKTAERALAAGADLLNDVWGFKEEPAIANVAARYDVPVCLMHNRRSTDYKDLIADIIHEMLLSVEIALKAGVKEHHIILDPGIGFGKDYEQNLEVMRHLKEIKNIGFPLLLGSSRKRIVGNTLNLPVEDRVEGTAATVAFGISLGVDIVRVHDVKEMKRVALMTDAMVRR